MKNSIGVFLLLISVGVFAQSPTMDLPTLLEKAVANNLQIQLQQQVYLQAEAAVNKGNAGQGLTIDALGGASYSNGFTDLTIRTFQPNPPEVKISEGGVQSISANAGVEAGLVLYDGQAGKLRFQILESVSAIQRQNVELQINQLAFQLLDLYAELLKLQQQDRLLLENENLIKARLEKIQDRIDFGKASQLDLLQGQTSLNLINSQRSDLELARLNLMVELADLVNEPIDPDTEFADLLVNPLDLSPEELRDRIASNNPQMQLNDLSYKTTDLEEQLTKANRRPVVNSFASVNYLYQNNDLQQLAQLQNVNGLVGVNIRYNLFDNGRHKSALQQAQITKDISRKEKDILLNRLLVDAQKAKLQIQNSQQQLELEQLNTQTYTANYEQVKSNWQSGKLPEISLREAELALINSAIKQANVKIDQQRAYAQLLLLTGDLIE
ncbi:MAG: TolC family protein [Bacteroidota bacterium]